jgi:hypothetical protein
MGTENTEGPTPPVKTTQTEEDQESNIVNLFDHKIKRINDETLIQECLMHLRFVELGLLTQDHKTRAEQLFKEAITRPALEYIKHDFMVALKVLKFL